MGDGPHMPARHDRRVHDGLFGRNRMLQWKPRLLLTLFVVGVLLAIAFVSGYSDLFEFLEW
jgi:hypothetical protein